MAAANKAYPYTPDYIVPPGETLRETMEAMLMTKESLAQRLGLTSQSLHRIFAGEQPIRPDTAAKLKMILGVPARFWNNLQTQYAEAHKHLLMAAKRQAERHPDAGDQDRHGAGHDSRILEQSSGYARPDQNP